MCEVVSTHLAMTPNKTICHEQILRAIGQGLEALGVEAFDLEVDNNNYDYVVHTYYKKPKRENPPTPNIFKEAIIYFRKKPKAQSATATPLGKPSSSCEILGLRFSQEEIDRLERQGYAKRSQKEGSPNAHSMSQILRTVGAYLDHKGGRLLRVSWSSPSVTLWHRNRFGVELLEQFTPTNLYDFWVHQYKRRKVG